MARAPSPRLNDLVDDWVGEGIIDSQQAALIREREGPTTPLEHQPLIALEAAGYLGGVITVVAATFLGFEYWAGMSAAVRLTAVGGAMTALLVAGVLVPHTAGALGARLRAVLWLAATAASAGFLAVIGHDVLDLRSGETAMLTSTGAAVVATLLWAARPTAPQQVAMMVTATIAPAVVIAEFSSRDALPGFGAWLVAAGWSLLAWGDLLPRRRLGLGLGAGAMIFAALTTIPSDAGVWLALLTIAAVVVAAVLLRDLVLLVIGAVGALNVLPAAVTTWFPDTTAAPLALLAVGVGLVGAALFFARRGHTRREARRDWASGPGWVAGTGAALLGALTLVLVLVVVLG